MTINKLIGKLLRFKGLKVTGLTFRKGNQLEIGVKPYKNGCRCPNCGKRGKIVRTRPELRRWRDIPVCGWTAWLLYYPREIHCPTHGRCLEDIPWADEYVRVTYRYEYMILRYCQLMTQKAAAQLLKVSQSTLSDQLHRTIQRLREGHRIRGLKTLGVDEISYCKGHKYATLVYDLDRSVVVWVGEGKGRETIDERFWEYSASWAAERFLKGWMTSAMRSRLDPLKKFVGTLRKHYDGVVAFVGTRLTNAIGEGLNRIVKIVKNRASGFRTLDAFTDMIFLVVGDLDIPGQIPTKFRTF